MAQAGLPVICVETRYTKAFLRAQTNESDRNDARGIAQMIRVNLYRPVQVKILHRMWRDDTDFRFDIPRRHAG